MNNIKRLTPLLLALLLAAGCAGSGPPAPSPAASGPSSAAPGLSSAASAPSSAAPGPSPAAPAEAEEPAPSGHEIAQPDGEPQLYSVYSGGRQYLFDRSGALLPEEEDYAPIVDDVTGEELYRVYSRDEDTGEDNQWGEPMTEHFSALYDAEGNLLYDWEPVYYQQAAGKLVIRYNAGGIMMIPQPLGDGKFSDLWDPATGQTVLSGVTQLQKITDGAYMALGPLGELLGVVDSEGNKLAGFPAPIACYYPTSYDGLIVCSNHDPYGGGDGQPRRDFILDKDLNLLFEGEGVNLGFVALRGPYMLNTGEGGRREVLSLDTFEPVYSYDDDLVSLYYFDGERMILQTGSRPDWQYTLCDAKGDPLTIPYDRIEYDYMSFDGDASAEVFLARAFDTAYLLDRDGEVLKTVTIPGATWFGIEDEGFYSYQVKQGLNSGEDSVGLLDSEFNVIIPAGTYSYISRAVAYRPGGRQYFDAWLGSKPINGMYRTDILSLGGELLISNLSSAGTISGSRICAVRGFSLGLMDWSGNWISRHSVYGGLGLAD